jgi:hypothetical protein
MSELAQLPKLRMLNRLSEPIFQDMGKKDWSIRILYL